MRRYLAGGSCRMELLRRDLDDPFAEPCGRCDVCAGAVVPDRRVRRRRRRRPATPSTAPASTSRRARSGRPAWPRSASTSRARSPADEQMADGRAVARLSDIGWGTRLRELVGPGAADDAPVTPRSSTPSSPCSRRGAGRSAPSPSWRCRRGPARSSIASLAERIAALGKLAAARLAGLRPRRPDRRPRRQQRPPPGRGVGAHRRPARRRRGRWPSLAGPVLLVDDVADSRWTLTVAARAWPSPGVPHVPPAGRGRALDDLDPPPTVWAGLRSWAGSVAR